MSAYRDGETRDLVDAAPAPAGIRVRTGPSRNIETETCNGEWIVLMGNGAYEVFSGTDFREWFYAGKTTPKDDTDPARTRRLRAAARKRDQCELLAREIPRSGNDTFRFRARLVARARG